MAKDRSGIVAGIKAFCAANPSVVLFDEASETLLDVGSGRPLHLPLAEIAESAERRNSVTMRPYLVLLLRDQRQLVLADAGIAFPPATPPQAQGPLPLPPVVCLRDFESVFGQLSHTTFDHPDEPPSAQALEMVMVCLAILGGARVAGFDISREERRLEKVLEELEKA